MREIPVQITATHQDGSISVFKKTLISTEEIIPIVVTVDMLEYMDKNNASLTLHLPTHNIVLSVFKVLQ